MAGLSSFFHRSTDRIHRSHDFWNDKRKGFVMASVVAMLALNLLFLADLSYLYGVVFKSTYRVHNFKMLMVDFDGGLIGQSVNGAYQQFQGNTFPTLIQHDVSEYPTEADVREAVCKGHYWGAIYSHRDASSRLSAALAGGDAATSYNPADTVTYIWNGARYPSFSQGYVQSNLAQLATAAGVVYHKINGTRAAQAVNVTDAAAVQALLNPIQGVAAPIQPTTHGTRVFYNTVGVIMPMLINFFFVMALNGISAQMQFLSRLPRLDNWIARSVLSVIFTFTAALVTTAFTWEYRESWAVSAGDFALTWMVLWLFMHVNYYVYDAITAFIPMTFLAFFVFTWIILNVGAAVAPFELTAGFYHWSYALPAKELYDVMTSIWSKGCANVNYRALPILFSWWLVGTVVSFFSTRRRCDDAMAAGAAERAKWEKILSGDEERQGRIATAQSANADVEKGEEPSRTPSTAAQSSA
ncbi:Nitrosoguanidine resistance [Lasiodiplodia theobromae]|uniref:Nitrosoguanidine resistance n=1 Tax=Lasiodiplodia theobromae TaxID=45133 RepID=UPI0015C2C3E0|nr:Nitrosoguanidine resistance [Lasiodiplodia theobromae]KAF4534553.1 Nitrosoguanidine resistance [Lasiodiplodia theobromae]